MIWAGVASDQATLLLLGLGLVAAGAVGTLLVIFALLLGRAIRLGTFPTSDLPRDALSPEERRISDQLRRAATRPSELDD